jgi:hypothetical protein
MDHDLDDIFVLISNIWFLFIIGMHFIQHLIFYRVIDVLMLKMNEMLLLTLLIFIIKYICIEKEWYFFKKIKYQIIKHIVIKSISKNHWIILLNLYELYFVFLSTC